MTTENLTLETLQQLFTNNNISYFKRLGQTNIDDKRILDLIMDTTNFLQIDATLQQRRWHILNKNIIYHHVKFVEI